MVMGFILFAGLGVAAAGGFAAAAAAGLFAGFAVAADGFFAGFSVAAALLAFDALLADDARSTLKGGRTSDLRWYAGGRRGMVKKGFS